jgi:hypothetical protein
VAELHRTETEAEQAAVETPTAAEPLHRLAQAAAEASRALDDPKLGLPSPIRPGPEPTGLLIETLVVQGLRLANETEPLQRADVCCDVADNLALTIMEASKKGSDRAEMVKLGTYLGTTNRAIASNLARVEINNDRKRRKEFERITNRAAQTMTDLQSEIQEAPPQFRQALQQALDASQSPTLATIPLDPDKE